MNVLFVIKLLQSIHVMEFAEHASQEYTIRKLRKINDKEIFD